ncbi:MAG: AbgT family transporter [Sedimentibacter sp.]|uniref:YfcC family protein n=1 Tax=Sedimentibacter sp. TaxID=1960295 RepID=UPI002981AA2B|nr:AbgT family transporter [Sedimentibacter sp.]MDW5299332.1 AbgT family transporter [Sedimentibacter sp.]
MQKTEKKKFKVPHIFIILLSIIFIVSVLTYFMPAGEFLRVEGPGGRMMVDPNSYHVIDSNPTGIMDFFTAIPRGFVEAGWVVVLTFCVGGGFVVVKKTMAINGAISWLSRKLAKKGIIIIPILMITFATIDCFIGMCELTMVYVPIILPLMFALGFDSITAAAVALVGSAVGFSAALANPFTVGIGQKIAGLPLYSGWEYRLVVLISMAIIGISFVMNYARKVRANPQSSCMYELDKVTKEFVGGGEETQVDLTLRQKLAGVSSVILFVVMVVGVFNWGWDMPEIGAIFIIIGIVAGIISGMSGKEICDGFLEGCQDVLLGALIVGIARGVGVVMADAKIIDTIIYNLSLLIQGLPGTITSIGMLVVQTLLNFLIPSGSGQTVVTMPIMAPLSDLVGVTRQTAILALQFGDGFSNIFYPVSGYFMATLALARVPYEKWMKVMLPLFGLFTAASAVFLVIAQVIQWGPF